MNSRGGGGSSSGSSGEGALVVEAGAVKVPSFNSRQHELATVTRHLVATCQVI